MLGTRFGAAGGSFPRYMSPELSSDAFLLRPTLPVLLPFRGFDALLLLLLLAAGGPGGGGGGASTSVFFNGAGLRLRRAGIVRDRTFEVLILPTLGVRLDTRVRELPELLLAMLADEPVRFGFVLVFFRADTTHGGLSTHDTRGYKYTDVPRRFFDVVLEGFFFTSLLSLSF